MTRGVDFGRSSGASGELSDGRDTASTNREITSTSGCPGTVDQRGVAYDEVVGFGRKRHRDERDKQAAKEKSGEAHG